ncbi:Tn3 family transposase, partial [Alcaligenes faecalis]|uniref:Tn3 family transposase n=1 Tax=Alcaligenes faecalis TaxID=511 RepID=UPI003B287B13
RAHWDEILRLATSIKQGTVTASLMLRKLGSYPRQNGLAVALRELGRIERTLFILDWLQSVELRRRVHAGLNKGEARNALARAVFFNRLGEIRDRSFEPLPPLRSVKVLDQLRERIRYLHYSLPTEQAYVHWVRAFIRFHGVRHPATLGSSEVEAFLSWLANERKVSVSTHRQALAALLFFYGKVLCTD